MPPALEQFLPRLFWAGSNLVETVGGKFIKATGDGFMAWFEVPLHRNLGHTVSAIFAAIWHFSFMVNVTQLGIESDAKYRIRNAVTLEHDALLLHLTDGSGHTSLDVLGRAVVLAFRLTAITADFPHLVTVDELFKMNGKNSKFDHLKKKKLSRTDLNKFFKGENWGTGGIYVSSKRKQPKVSREQLQHNIEATILQAETGKGLSTTPADDLILEFNSKMLAGPEWAKQVVTKQHEFARDQLLGNLKKLLPMLKEPPKPTVN